MIRAYKPSDLEGILNVWYEVAQVAYNFLPQETLDAIKDDLQNEYMDKAQTWVATHDGDIVGFIAIVENVVGGLFVLPAFQNMGIGKSLIKHARKRKGAVSLNVLKESSKVLQFYERCGFIPTKEGICPITSLETVTVKLD